MNLSTDELGTIDPAVQATVVSFQPERACDQGSRPALADIVGLFSAAGSALVTLIGFSVAAVLTGWYLRTRREP